MAFTNRQMEHHIKNTLLPTIETNLFQYFKKNQKEETLSFTEEFDNIIKTYIGTLKGYFCSIQNEKGQNYVIEQIKKKIKSADENYGKIKPALNQLDNIYKIISGIQDMITQKEDEINIIKIKHASLVAEPFSIKTEIDIIRMKHYENSLNEECDFLVHKVKEHSKTFDNLDLAIRSIKEKINKLYMEIQDIVKEFIENRK